MDLSLDPMQSAIVLTHAGRETRGVGGKGAMSSTPEVAQFMCGVRRGT